MKSKTIALGLTLLAFIDANNAAAAQLVSEVDFKDITSSMPFYCEYNNYPSGEEKEASLGNNLMKRRSEIINAAQAGANVIRISGLNDIDLYALCCGILKRAVRRDIIRLAEVDLKSSEITPRGFDILFTGLVNKGISQDFGRGADGQNFLQNIKICLPSMDLTESQSDIQIATDNNIHFILGEE